VFRVEVEIMLGGRACAPALRTVALTLFLLTQAVAPASAQVTSTPDTPEPHGYRGASQTLPYQGAFSDLMNEIDAFWARAFQQEGVPYAPPNIFVVEQETSTGCGIVQPVPNAFYCDLDRTIYLVPQFLVEQEQKFGDYAPIAVLSHEWGHHIQTLLGVVGPTRKDFELQADCLMGVFTRHADDQELLDYGDFLEVLNSAIDAGDDVFLPEDFPGAHGLPEDRVKALTKGYGGGPVTGCELPMVPIPDEPENPERSPDPSDPSRPSETRQVPSVTEMLPRALPLKHAACFRIDNDRVLTFDELAANLGGTQDARARLQAWGWQASANRRFACDTPPDGDAGSIDISLHLFGDAASAQQAVDYFAAVRAEGSTLISADPPAIGDYATVLSGPTSNGKEFTLYMSQGPLLVRVTGVSTSGIPFINVLNVAQSILAMPMPQVHPQEQSPAPHDVAVYLPQTVPLEHAACFGLVDEGTLDFPALVDRFPDVPDAASRLQALVWQAGAYRQFGCDGPPAGHAGWIDISVHQFADAASATAAVPFFADSRALGSRLAAASAPSIGDRASALTGPASNGTEYTLYVSHGALLVRITGVAPIGNPASDVEQVMMGVLAGMDDLTGTPPEAIPTSVPSTAIPIPTATPVPTATLVPITTPTPAPTSTPLPLPTATSTPSPGPSATAPPLPTPTPTPRDIVLLPTVTATPMPAAQPTVASNPTADAESLLDLLATTPFPEELLVHSSVELSPQLDEESGHLGGLIGGVDIDTGGGIFIGASSISYAVYPGPEEAERSLTLWQQEMQSWLETQIDVSGPALGPRAVVLTDVDGPYPLGVCGAVVGPVVVRVSAVGLAETDRDYLNSIVLGNCEGAVAHLRSLLETS
jgi:uncharacterized protein